MFIIITTSNYIQIYIFIRHLKYNSVKRGEHFSLPLQVTTIFRLILFSPLRYMHISAGVNIHPLQTTREEVRGQKKIVKERGEEREKLYHDNFYLVCRLCVNIDVKSRREEEGRKKKKVKTQQWIFFFFLLADTHRLYKMISEE